MEVVSPSELAAVLHTLGMDELGPAVVFLGIRTNEDFRRACGYDEAIKQKMLYDNMKGIKPSPFQKLALKVALTTTS